MQSAAKGIGLFSFPRKPRILEFQTNLKFLEMLRRYEVFLCQSDFLRRSDFCPCERLVAYEDVPL